MSRFLLIAVLLLSCPLAAQENVRVPQSKAEMALSFAPIVKKVAPAVVNIYTKTLVRQRVISPFMDDPFFREFFGDAYPQGLTRQRVQNALGSGVIVGADGVVVTNNHVIEGADEIVVVLSDRREFEARLIATDKRSDLAVLRLKSSGEKFPTLSFADSDEAEVGDVVLAIGNPFGVGQTVTMGIVSAVARAADVSRSAYNYFIQTDAAINPGNSGGALVGADGRLLGIPSAIYSRDGGSLGIGFAIPSNLVRTILSSGQKGGNVVHGWVGFIAQTLTADLAKSVGLNTPGGVIVKSIHPQSPARDLKVGDVITKVNGHMVADEDALQFRIGTTPVGGKLSLTIMRQGEERNLDVDVIAPPDHTGEKLAVLTGQHALAGAKVANISPALAQELGLSDDSQGVVIMAIAPRSAAALLGLQRGDFVVAINNNDIRDVADLVAALKSAASPMRIAIRRGEQIVTVVVR